MKKNVLSTVFYKTYLYQIPYLAGDTPSIEKYDGTYCLTKKQTIVTKQDKKKTNL